MESASSGLMAGINAVRRLNGQNTWTLPGDTMIGALSRYIASGGEADFQPMGANFGVMPPLDELIRDKERAMPLFQPVLLNSLDRILSNNK